MNDAPVADTSLIAVEARTEDIGRGILRVDPEAMQAMDLRSGDTVEIVGERTALARLLPNFPPDRGKREAHMDGITRANVMALCRLHDIPLRVGGWNIDFVRGASEAFVTGTMGGITPVASIDGRRLEHIPGPFTTRLTALYEALKDADAARGAKL